MQFIYLHQWFFKDSTSAAVSTLMVNNQHRSTQVFTCNYSLLITACENTQVSAKIVSWSKRHCFIYQMFNQVLYTDFTLVTILTHSTAQTTLSAIDSSLEKACHLILGFENQYSSILVLLFIVLYSQKHDFSPFQNHLYSIARVRISTAVPQRW